LSRTLDPGWVLSGLTLTEKAAQTTGTITAPTTDPRIDRIVIDDTTGTVSVITGAEAASPSPPALTSGKLPVAQVALAVGQTEVANADITDERAWPLQVAIEFTSGDRLVFQQTTAPTGYTKETDSAFNDVALRIVTGTASSGGADAFATVFGSSITTGGHSLSQAELASHSGHVTNTSTLEVNSAMSATNVIKTITTTNKGGDNSHDHTMTMNLKYRDIIIAQKD